MVHIDTQWRNVSNEERTRWQYYTNSIGAVLGIVELEIVDPLSRTLKTKWLWSARVSTKYRLAGDKPINGYADSLEDAKLIVEFLINHLWLKQTIIYFQQKEES